MIAILPVLPIAALLAQVPQPPSTGQRRFQPKPPPKNPLSGLTEPPKAGSGPKYIYPDHADTVEVLPDDKYLATGNVVFRFENYTVHCDRATYDGVQRTVVLEGNVTLADEEQTVRAEKVTINVDTREFDALFARTTVPTDRIGQNLQQPLQISGGSYAQVGTIYRAKDGFLTTCDYPVPHYKIGFHEATVYPKSRIVLKKATLYINERIVARIGYLSIPITDEIRYSYLPTFGRTNEEGYFVKAVLGYSLARTLPGLLHLDYMQKKGFGVGFDQAYRIGQSAAGTATYYTLKDRSRKVNNSNGRLNHEQRFGNIDLRIASDFQNNSYQSVSSDSRSRNSTITFNQAVGGAQTGLSVNLTGSSSGTSLSSGQNYSITRTQPIGKQGSLNVRLAGNDNASTFGTGDAAQSTGRTERLAEVRASGQAGSFHYELQANKELINRQTTSGGTGAATGVSVGFSGTERLPELTLTAEPQKLGALGKALPLRLTLGYGRFVEPGTAIATSTTPGKLDVERLLLATDLPSVTKPLTPGGRLSVSTNGAFRQLVYPGSQAALYTLTNSSALSLRLGGRSSANLSYGYLRPYGGLPIGFRLDQSGSNNNLSFNLTQEGTKARLNVLTGYDIQRAQGEPISGTKKNPWQNLALQVGLRPKPSLQTRFTGAYDINSGKLIDLTNHSRWKFADSFGLDVGLRYDPKTKKLAQGTENLSSWLLNRRTRIGVGSSYNGFTKRFDYKNATLSHRYHDYELTLSYIDQPFGSRSEKGFNIGFRLLAFPAPATSTAGRFGTLQDTGTGEVY